MFDKSWMLKVTLDEQYTNASYQKLKQDLFFVDREIQRIGGSMENFDQGTAIQLYKYANVASYLRDRAVSHQDFANDTNGDVDKIAGLSKYGENLKYAHNATRSKPWALSKEMIAAPFKRAWDNLNCYENSPDEQTKTHDYKTHNLDMFLSRVLGPTPLQIVAPKPNYITDKTGVVYQVVDNKLTPVGHVRQGPVYSEAVIHGAPTMA